jgi:hypothetical protein
MGGQQCSAKEAFSANSVTSLHLQTKVAQQKMHRFSLDLR